MAAAMSQVHEAITILEKALPNLQVGSDQHKATVDSIGKLAKAFPATAKMPGIQNTTLMSLMRDAQQSAPMKAIQGGMAGGGGAGGAPPPGAAPGGPPGGGLAAMMGGGASPPEM